MKIQPDTSKDTHLIFIRAFEASRTFTMGRDSLLSALQVMAGPLAHCWAVYDLDMVWRMTSGKSSKFRSADAEEGFQLCAVNGL